MSDRASWAIKRASSGCGRDRFCANRGHESTFRGCECFWSPGFESACGAARVLLEAVRVLVQCTDCVSSR
jgi:hypothetical protein